MGSTRASRGASKRRHGEGASALVFKPIRTLRLPSLLDTSGFTPSLLVAKQHTHKNCRMFPDSVDGLRIATSMQAGGQLPPSIALWCVDNPMLVNPAVTGSGRARNGRPAEGLLRKADAGAQVVLTQPPLLWSEFERWADDVARLGLPPRVRVVVGAAMLSSARNAEFWMALCGLDPARCPEAQLLLAEFAQAEQVGKERLTAFCRSYNERTLARLLALPGVAGLHVMPLTRPAREMALEMFCAPGAVQRLAQGAALPDGRA